jgi:hypothetical protein
MAPWPDLPRCFVPRPLRCGDSQHGIVQHSFALQLSEQRRPFDGWENSSRVAERFDGGPFRARPVSGDLPSTEQFEHSPLAREGLSTLRSLQATYIRPNLPGELSSLPDTFKWADPNCCSGCTNCERYDDPSVIFADSFDDERIWSINDFLICKEANPARRPPVSQALLELMAHKRSRLFGFALANRFVNVLLPHAILYPSEPGASHMRPWFLQPLVSFVRGGSERGRLRKTYALTFFLIPITGAHDMDGRLLSTPEIKELVNVGWGFAAQTAKKAARFQVSGELFEYLPGVARNSLALGPGVRFPSGRLSLRELIEWTAFGVGLTLAQGRTGRASPAAEQLIGNDIIGSLGSARVSSVVVTDPELEKGEVRRSMRGGPAFPKPLLSLLGELSDPIRAPLPDDQAGHKYRLDRAFVDDDIYATAVLPTKRCLVVVSRADVQCGVRESALMQAGSIAYMTIGAATAIGTLRAIDNRLEFLEGTGPKGIAEIDREIAADLSEIYDLDITRESYREIYRRLRKRLGIARDYETLQDKMQALYRATSTLHEVKTQARLVWLTGAIVLLSVFIVIGTIVLAGKG